MTHTWSGCGTALVTPFTAGGAVDESAVRRLAARQIDAGIHFLAPCGTTGESPTLSRAEQRRVVELVVETAGRAGARARRRGRLRHSGRDRSGGRHATGRGGRHLVSHPVLQQTDPRGHLPALPGARREHPVADCGLQRAGSHRLQRGRRHTVPAGRYPEHRRGQGGLGRHAADVRDLPFGPDRVQRAVWRRPVRGCRSSPLAARVSSRWPRTKHRRRCHVWCRWR